MDTTTLTVTRDPDKHFLEPWNAGQWSASTAVCRDLSKLLSLLGQFSADRVQGPAADQIRDFRLYLHYALKDDGYRIYGTDSGWKVLEPRYPAPPVCHADWTAADWRAYARDHAERWVNKRLDLEV